VSGLVFPECPRWHEGKLWFSDMHARKVMTVDMEGNTEVVVEVPGNPGGLGWLPDGRLLVVSQTDKKLLRLDPDGLKEVADLSGLAGGDLNDMVVDALGRAYIGNWGAGTLIYISITPAEVIMVTPEGDMSLASAAMVFPNGSVITPDGNKLIVAESFGPRLTAFDIDADGSLTGRRIWANFPGYPDGICLDAEGAVWGADASGKKVIRVLEGGEVTDRIKTSLTSYACALGGPDGRTLFICTAETNDPTVARTKASARIETIRVEVPGAAPPVAPTSTGPVSGFKVSGTIQLVDQVIDSSESAGSLVIEKGTVYLEYHGTLEGTVVKKYTLEVNVANYQITGTATETFTGTVNGKAGTLTWEDTISGQITGIDMGVFFEINTIISGTGELSNLRGVIYGNESFGFAGARGLYWGVLEFEE
jgi:sugar lactone lactonase YvrE